MSTATLTSKGQTTIPKEVRERLRLQPGDRLEFVMKDDVVILRPATRKVTDIKGFFPKPERSVSIAEMNKAIRRRAGK
jgi:AbrB family looped-hinge helix DNA binding protein